MSVERPLWRALAGYRVLTLCYAVGLFALSAPDLGRPWIGVGYLLVLAGWTVATLPRVGSASRCTPGFLAADMTVAVSGILLTLLADPERAVNPTLPSIWVAGSVLAFAIRGGWRWAAAASALVGVANLIENGGFSRSTVHNVLLVSVAAVAIGYVVEVARASERTLARALRIEAAGRERERLARDIHDGVLQVLAMVRRRGDELGGEAAELGRLAGEQEVALRALITGAPPLDPVADPGPGPGRSGVVPGGDPDPGARADLRALLAARARDRVTFAGPAGAVLLPVAAAREVDAAVAAALDNVERHAVGPDGTPARAWVLLEDEGETVLVTVRDEGPGIPPGRLEAAAREGRLGVSHSIRGRLRELGGEARWESVPGEGTEVEMTVPRGTDA
ncbi:MacS family sensor histidine kinase [Streptomyces sp. ST2-7A]|uniref:MacS family sensor histidine kinase n=1 Tax=Streptomyces sp. ST2-7A TaxID=2907214 RepID=UPI001F2BE6A2|nr:DUF5931 domain-containing protein [Streptomyces sp. ST2-7A]MCE7083297.1 DUF5931 domain-containing protein [Streptomyces sp. ST2-7A]